jgi:hypothetical protein
MSHQFVSLSKSDQATKKWKVVLKNTTTNRTKTIHFGNSDYEDYTQHHDSTRKASYLARHQAREDWTDPTTAGFWSRWLLWNKPTLQGSLSDLRKQFHI